MIRPSTPFAPTLENEDIDLRVKPRVASSTDIERARTADERAAAKIKPQDAVRIPRDADPHALPDFAWLVITAPEP
jgi:hypothetical protein